MQWGGGKTPNHSSSDEDESYALYGWSLGGAVEMGRLLRVMGFILMGSGFNDGGEAKRIGFVGVGEGFGGLIEDENDTSLKPLLGSLYSQENSRGSLKHGA